MLPKQNRITKNSDFRVVFKKGENYKNRCLLFKITENQLEQIRFGFLINKKSFKKSTQRNKIKRRLANLIKKELPVLKQGFDVVIIPRAGLENKKAKELKETVETIFRKAKLFKK